MKKKNIVSEVNNVIDKIAKDLLMNASFNNDVGLYYGKMGALLFFYNYDSYKNNDTYFNYANSLTVEISKELNKNNTNLYSSGISGIGAAFKHLVNYDFIEDSDVFKNIEKSILSIPLPIRFDLETYGTAFFLSSSLSDNSTYGDLNGELDNLMKKELIIDRIEFALERCNQIFERLHALENLIRHDLDEKIILCKVNLIEEYAKVSLIVNKFSEIKFHPLAVDLLKIKGQESFSGFMNKLYSLVYKTDPTILFRNRVLVMRVLLRMYNCFAVMECENNDSKISESDFLSCLDHIEKIVDKLQKKTDGVELLDIYGVVILQRIAIKSSNKALCNFINCKIDRFIQNIINELNFNPHLNDSKNYLNIGITGMAGIGLLLLDYLSDDLSPWDELLLHL